MYFADYHTHTRLSPDGKAHANHLSMAEAAIRAGLSELCITEHCECNGFWYSADSNIGFTFNPPVARLRLEQARERFGKQILLPWGVELGQATHVPERANEILSHDDYDYVIGSFHNLRDTVDFSLIDYESPAHCYRLLTEYLSDISDMIDTVAFDCIGHVDYPLRYMRRKFPEVCFAPVEEQLRAVLRKAALAGKAIEINTKASRGAHPIFTYQDVLLSLWKEAGGKYLTFGSDAHMPEDVGAGIRNAKALAEAAGFTASTVYRRHEPENHPF